LPPVPVDPETARALEAIAYTERVTPAALVRRVLGQYVAWHQSLTGDLGPWED
jgi:hypothetical protein